MKIAEHFLYDFYERGRYARRASWPVGDHVTTDGAYDQPDDPAAPHGTIWYYCADTDELTPGYAFGFHDLAAGDWEFT